MINIHIDISVVYVLHPATNAHLSRADKDVKSLLWCSSIHRYADNDDITTYVTENRPLHARMHIKSTRYLQMQPSLLL